MCCRQHIEGCWCIFHQSRCLPLSIILLCSLGAQWLKRYGENISPSQTHLPIPSHSVWSCSVVTVAYLVLSSLWHILFCRHSGISCSVVTLAYLVLSSLWHILFCRHSGISCTRRMRCSGILTLFVIIRYFKDARNLQMSPTPRWRHQRLHYI